MPKFKHNKKRNSSFLYEALIQELTKAVVSKDESKKETIVKMIKESFNSKSAMYLELKLYRAITHTKGAGVVTAEKIINEVKRRHAALDQKKLIKEQESLVRKIRKSLSDDTFSNFVPNYKQLASIAQIFNNNVSVKSKILLENEVVASMTSKETDKQRLEPIDNIVYKSFVKKFNEEYGDKLLSEQKDLLGKFVNSFGDNSLELKAYLNEEIGRLKKAVSSSKDKEEFLEDKEMSKNINKVLDMLETYKDRKPDAKMIEEVVMVQGLVWELTQDVN